MKYFDENNEQDKQEIDLIKYLEQQMDNDAAKETMITIHHKDGKDEDISVSEKNRRQIGSIKRLKKREYFYNQAICYYKKGSYDKAEPILFDLLKNQNNVDLDVYERLAIMYRKQKRYIDEYDILEQELIDISKHGDFNTWVIEKIEKRRDKAKMLMEKDLK